MLHVFDKCILFLKGPTNALVFVNEIVLQSNKGHVSATHAAIFSGEHKDTNI
jgi:hypothetical protein